MITPARLRFAAASLAALATFVSPAAARRGSGSPQLSAAPADFSLTGTFPSSFLLGVAVSSHQVEGGLANDWTLFEQSDQVADSGEAVRHRDLAELEADLDRAQGLGLTAYRFSIEWSRIEPQRNVFDPAALQYYEDALDRIRARGLVPVVGLHHFTLPTWLLDPAASPESGGWTDPATVSEFVNYASYVASALGSRVDRWVTLNEPNAQAAGGYASGAWSPGVTGRWDLYLRAVNNMIRAHRQAFLAIKQHDLADADGDGRPALVGIVQNVKPIYPRTAGVDDADARDWDYVFHKQFLDAILPVYDTGAFPVPAAAAPSRTFGATCWDSDVDYACDVAPNVAMPFADFIGLNYHLTGTSVASSLGASNPPLGDRSTGGIRNSVLLTNARMGYPAGEYPSETFARGPWEIDPAGLLTVLRDLWGRYRLPIIVTEHGVAEAGIRGRDCSLSKRPAAIVSHLQMILQALAEGIPVQGYFHWSLVDNFEWREGYETRGKFGLFSVTLNAEEIPLIRAGQPVGPSAARELDPSVPGYQQRVQTPAATAYRQVASAHGITPAILQRWGSYPRLLGDNAASGPVRIVSANPPFASPGDTRVDAVDSIATALPPGCRVIDASVMLTDASGVPVAPDANYRQGGRIADTRVPPLRRVELRDVAVSGSTATASVAWSRVAQLLSDGKTQYLAGFAYRPVYRLECSGSDIDGDGILNACDVCPSVADPAQTDTDGDGVGDACQPATTQKRTRVR